MTKEYAGVGSRDTPAEVLTKMRQLATALEKVGYVLRSGGAKGADSAFEAGVVNQSNKSIFLPYKGFNGNRSPYYGEPSETALEWASKAHPYFTKMKEGFARSAHARNVNQVLGHDCKTPCHFVLCWTPDGAEFEGECHSTDVTGGTRTAIVIASMNNIPVFNLARPDAIDRLRAHVKGLPIPERLPWSADPAFIDAIKKQKQEKRKKSFSSSYSPR